MKTCGQACSSELLIVGGPSKIGDPIVEKLPCF